MSSYCLSHKTAVLMLVVIKAQQKRVAVLDSGSLEVVHTLQVSILLQRCCHISSKDFAHICAARLTAQIHKHELRHYKILSACFVLAHV